jgi:hypothetical protein
MWLFYLPLLHSAHDRETWNHHPHRNDTLGTTRDEQHMGCIYSCSPTSSRDKPQFPSRGLIPCEKKIIPEAREVLGGWGGGDNNNLMLKLAANEVPTRMASRHKEHHTRRQKLGHVCHLLA